MSFTQTELTTVITAELKGLADNFDATDYGNAFNAAVRDTGWAFPVSDGFRTTWTLARARRWLYSYLLSQSAYKFKYKQINLQHRFDHFKALVDMEDADWTTAQEDNPQEFITGSSLEIFGTKGDAGFQYEPQTGIDTTYTSANEVIHKPDASS